MSDIFVSYKVEDRRRVQPLVEALEADGLSVWWDTHIGGGDDWRDSIQRHLDESKCVIVVWSKRSVGPEGHFVRDEATRALRRHTYLPVRIERVDSPLGFGETQVLSLIGWKGDRADHRYQSVLEAARAVSSGRPRPSQVHFERPAVTRRTVLGGAAVAGAAAALAGGWLLLRPTSPGASDSIAVLPFANLSGDPTQAYFSDGIAEELRSALTRLAGLKVVGRNSSEVVRNDDAATAANKLKVANILTGSVRRTASLIRVSAQLIDGHSGLEKWSENYDRTPGDVIRIQTDIAENVARALSVALGRTARAAITLGGTNNATAHDRFLKAVAVAQSSEEEPVHRQALQLVDGALALDPNYAEAHALRGLILRRLFGMYSRGPEMMARGMREAIASARKAIALEPRLAAGHITLAAILAAQLDLRGALVEYRKAQSLSPNDPQLLLQYGDFLSELGRTDEAAPMVEKAIDLDPLNPDAFYKRSVVLFITHRYADTINAAKQVLALSPNHASALGILGDSYQALGKLDEARKIYEQMPADHPYRLASGAILAARLGDRTTSDRLLQRLRDLYGDSAGWQIAVVHAQRGEIDEALSGIERGYAARDPGIGWIRVDPWLAPLRKEPRFQAIIRKLNFPS